MKALTPFNTRAERKCKAP